MKMETIEYKGEILSDGHLSCPDEVKRKLHLTNGSKVKVSILPIARERITRLKGIWDGIRITAEDIEASRKEMWGNLGKDL
jgi:hypothetical protein